MSISSILHALKIILQIIVASQAFKSLVTVLVDWLCVQIGNFGEWLIKKAQAHKKKYVDDEECFE